MLKYVSKLFFSLAGYSQCTPSFLIRRIKSLRAIDWKGAEDIIPF